MKTTYLKNLLFITGILVAVIACTDDTLDFAEPENAVMTLSPEIEGDQVTFRGRVSESYFERNFNYGFMWYISDGEEFTEPVRIEVGNATEALNFSLGISSLPVNKNLVVCAYAEASRDESTYIGNEVNFEVPR